MSEEKKYETTPEHFEIFKAEAQKFIDLFGLHDWKVFFERGFYEYILAICEHDTENGKVASLILSTNWDKIEPSNEALRQTAFHEVCHLLLADAYDAACYIDLSSDQRRFHVERAHHAVIRRFENVVLPKL